MRNFFFPNAVGKSLSIAHRAASCGYNKTTSRILTPAELAHTMHPAFSIISLDSVDVFEMVGSKEA